jgi:hypothetical protein
VRWQYGWRLVPVNRPHQVVAALREQSGGGRHLAPVERCGYGPLQLRLAAARRAPVQVLLHPIFFLRRQLAVKIQGDEFNDRFAIH